MFVFTADKAGMKGVDKQHVQEVVHKMSKDSSFYQKSLRDNEKVEQRVAAMRKKLAGLTGGQQLRLQQEADERVARMEATRDLSKTIVVVDMDMFYAAVEMRDDPKLCDVPLAVGGMNMISTTNYAARQFGVRAAMPGFIGKELCPELHFVPVNMEKYAGVAAQVRAVFAQYDPNFEAFSLDEACLDLTDYVAKNWQKYASVALDDFESKEEVQEEEEQWPSTPAGRAAIAAAVVRELRQKIFDCTQLTASAGIAVNAMLAKICSDMNKPNGQYVLPFTRERVLTFLCDLPVRKIGGIGKVTEKILNEALGVHTGGELFNQRGKIFHLFTEKTAVWLLQTSLGVRERREKQERKSFSRERTFRSLSDPKELEAKCLEVCKMLAKDLEKANKAAKNVTFVYKDTDFARCSRSVTLASAIFTAEDLYSSAVELLRRELPLTLRLLGVRAATLVHRPNSSGSVSISSQSEGAKKRQLVINNSNQTTALEVENKPCPICSKLLNVKNNMEVNAHMDACVVSKKPKQSGITQAFTAVQESEKVDEYVKPCPICGKLLNARSCMEVNAHLDVCVTRDRSPPSRSVLGKKRGAHDMSATPRRKPENSIDVFFRKNV
ncbi:hypothetical protein PHYSODRAFT_552269 [Phytophthora sojae]|uniref:DNA polymerase kappa n=1 Tax=Phytophthora sojae (strain P6497) TaxID=1094619 RepID=G4YKE9_PHYSP|nr:hypothetical protein PHYSODRAFT_552269 [Phytophthora sojae]EGZ28529.1 hypothetical protein PHYSODRAFT_552269 [Phytophthora sojae]|eukprot:XP_009515804.1 hypothetical protein PHYSODRAFT_552269 [Phytophthora sojae]